jgi:hypothetical protein
VAAKLWIEEQEMFTIKSNWNADKIKLLRELFTFTDENGVMLSYGVIAERLGLRRQYIIKKIKQLGLSRDNMVPVLTMHGTIFDPRGRPVPEGDPRPARTRTASPAPLVAPDEPPARSPYAVSFDGLGVRICRYPIGHVGEEEFHFCGADTTSSSRSYCDYHHSICYFAPKKPGRLYAFR